MSVNIYLMGRTKVKQVNSIYIGFRRTNVHMKNKIDEYYSLAQSYDEKQ